MTEPTAALKAALDQFAADVAAVRTAAEKIAAGERGARAREPSTALLRFHQALLVFGSALLSALLIGFPDAKTIELKIGGYDGARLYAHTLTNLVWMIAVAGIVAFLTQVFQPQVNAKGFSAGNSLFWLFAVLTAGALAFGIRAAWPYLTAL
jgi:hypothetical protein